MRLVIARCTVDYAGRLDAHLPEAVRLIMVKADGCVAVHADGGAYKPLNWMNAPNRLVVGRNVKPGQQIQLAVFGMNGPISNPPTNFIWVREARLEFFRGEAGPVALAAPREVNVEVIRRDPALDPAAGRARACARRDRGPGPGERGQHARGAPDL